MKYLVAALVLSKFGQKFNDPVYVAHNTSISIETKTLLKEGTKYEPIYLLSACFNHSIVND